MIRDPTHVKLQNALGVVAPSNPLDVSTSVWANIKFDADDSAPIYIGLNLNANSVDGDTDWRIYKFTYSGSAVIQIQMKTGSWTNRASLGW